MRRCAQENKEKRAERLVFLKHSALFTVNRSECCPSSYARLHRQPQGRVFAGRRSAPHATAAATEAARGFIGVDRAKSIALGHAGVSASSVSFSKAKLDDDDGRGVYEIEFYVGNTEYDYEIDAHSGSILEASAEND